MTPFASRVRAPFCTIFWIAWRLALELVRDRRTVAFLFLVPLAVMTLVDLAVSKTESIRLSVVTRGPARLFEGDLIKALESEDDVELVSLSVSDDQADPVALAAEFELSLARRQTDAIVYMDATLLSERFEGARGNLHIYVEGSRPTVTAGAFSSVASAMDDLASALPVVIGAECSESCADSVNIQPMNLEKHYLYGNDDMDTIDFFLPVMPPFFVFFFSFILSNIAFQRERVRGTLERLLIAPVSFGEIVLGTMTGFLGFALAQATIVTVYFTTMFHFPLGASELTAMALVMGAVLCVGLLAGLAASFLAQNEFQAVQFVPLVILPQLFLSDIIWNVQSLPMGLQWLSRFLPLTYANAIVRDVLIRRIPWWNDWPEFAALMGFAAVAMALLFAFKQRAIRE